MERDEIQKKYPYAEPTTFAFLQTVVADGTQNTVPRRMNMEQWIRARNITGAYFSCNITTDELARMYGVTKQRIDFIVSYTIRHFWENSIGYDRMRFPIEKLSTENPATRQRIHGMSRGNQIKLEAAILGGALDIEIEEKFGLSLNTIRPVMRKFGKRENITSRRQQVKNYLRKLDELPVEKYEERQMVIDSLIRPVSGFHATKGYGGQFVSLHKVAGALGWSVPDGRYSTTDDFVAKLKQMRIPVSWCEKIRAERRYRYVIIHRKDLEHLKEKISSTNPSETLSPTF